ncbi:family 78 glycoside hydrolase catalytic domain [Chitinophaga sp.]|uniref:family 78 glycoside hydrolase catalytic domain n=1 Tax=Chitinophaga sp. TaxID=1869181 RepID=UPI0031E049AE
MQRILFYLLCCLPGFLHAQLKWSGSWITNTTDTTITKAPFFRKVFHTAKPLQSAVVYVSGVGYHVLYVNGKPVTDAVLEQGYTRYDKRLLYNTYDITSLWANGDNVVAAELGNGWYNVQSHAVWEFHKAPWRNTPRMLINILLTYKDGSTETLVTDRSWKCATGPSQYNNLYTGEIYDARAELPGWNKPGYNDASWQTALETNSPGGILVPQEMPSIKIIRRIKPVSVKQVDKGEYLFDMGQNFAGVVTLKVKGAAGTKVTLSYREVLKNGKIDLAHNTEHMRSWPGELPFQTDVYILKGNGVETFTPQFTYHGFQYVSVKTDGNIKLDKASLEGLFYSTDFKEAGHFTSSDPMINKLYEAARQSYRSNFLSIPTDCPQREKNGWTADAHISAEIGLWNYKSAPGYRKWLDDIRDAQTADGSIPGIVPSNGWGYDRKDFTFGPAWGSALPVITWYLYLYEGDTAAVRENYDAIKKYTDLLTNTSEHYIFKMGLGDWMSLVETPVPFTSTACYYTDAVLVSKMARILGKDADAATYAALAEKISAAFNREYYNTQTMQYNVTTATALSTTVYHQLVPAPALTRTVDQLAQKIKDNHYHADFGVLGTKYVLPSLSDNGHVELAMKMLTDTGYAGWAHWIANGATSLFEDWPGELSHNHIFFGDYCAWFYKTLAGIRPDEAAPGFKHFFIQPSFVSQLTFAKADYECRYGKIVSSWKRVGKQVILEVEVPAHTTATLRLPGREDKTLQAGKHKLTI